MKKNAILALLAFFGLAYYAQAQDEEPKESPLEVSGSIDLYYKYDFAGSAADFANISGGEGYTFFAPDNNSFSIGMANVIFSKEVGKTSFVADLSFGPRGGSSSVPTLNTDDGSFHIQNLYVSHSFSDVVTMSAGYMGTFVGYEVISPASNFNYSTSHLFSWGPFQNAGLKFDFAIADNFGAMIGIFNDWNTYTDFTSSKDIGLQLSYSPADGMDIYLNYITGEASGSEIDLTAGFQFTDAFYLGVNAASFGAPDEEKLFTMADGVGFVGFALYPQYAISDAVSLGLRYENFSEKENTNGIFGAAEATTISSITLSANIASGPLTFIPEFRIDSGSEDVYIDSDGVATGSASQFLMAAVYSF